VATYHIWRSATQRSELNTELINKSSGVATLDHQSLSDLDLTPAMRGFQALYP